MVTAAGLLAKPPRAGLYGQDAALITDDVRCSGEPLSGGSVVP